MGGGAQKWEYFAGGGIRCQGSLQQTLLRASSPHGASKPAGSYLIQNVHGDGCGETAEGPSRWLDYFYVFCHKIGGSARGRLSSCGKFVVKQE